MNSSQFPTQEKNPVVDVVVVINDILERKEIIIIMVKFV